MRIHIDGSTNVTRRGFLQAICVAFAAGFTAIADELDRLMRWCSRDGGPHLLGAR